ncbi:MAG: hypothetical protein ABGW77_07030 [Campylobacterales bacterium]
MAVEVALAAEHLIEWSTSYLLTKQEAPPFILGEFNFHFFNIL